MMGRSLARTLENRIDQLADARATDELTMSEARSQVIRQMGNEADIEPGTVRQILNAEIDCPPPERIRGFAQALDVSAQSLFDAAEEDGCMYEQSAERAAKSSTRAAKLRIVKKSGTSMLQLIQPAR